MEELVKAIAKELGFDDQKVEGKKRYLGITDKDIRLLKAFRKKFKNLSSGFWVDFYDHLFSMEEAREILKGKGEDLIEHLKEKQNEYLEEMLSGRYDLHYVLNRLQVGIKHEQANVSPILFTGAFSTYCTMTLDYLEKVVADKSTALATVRSLIRLVLFDIMTALQGYYYVREKKLVNAKRENEKLNRMYRVLCEINSLIARERDMERLFHDACRILVELGEFDLVWIGILDPSTKRIVPAAASGITKYLDDILISTDPSIPEGQGPGGIAIRENRTVAIDDSSKDPRFAPWKERAEKFGLKSAIALPLRNGKGVFGALVIYSSKYAFFTHGEVAFLHGEVALLEEIANNMSLAQEHYEKGQEVERLLFYDNLTGLGNEKYFLSALGPQLGAARERNGRMMVVVIDIDKFGNINHALGYTKGDTVLKEVGKRLNVLMAGKGMVSRSGPDEFTMLYPVQNESDIAMFSERMKNCLSKPINLDEESVNVSASMGISLYPQDGASKYDLINCARVALREAQKRGTGQVNFYTSELSEKISSVVNLTQQLKTALEKGQFVLFHQPKIGLHDRNISGLEALVRWEHPDLGLMPPGKFIPTLEETGLIKDVGKWVLEETCRHLRDGRLGSSPDLIISCNVSPRQFEQPDFAEDLIEIVKESGADPKRLQIEITETALITDIENALEKLTEVNRLGVGISIDDFGTGYSSLAYLKKIPATNLKIDQSFVRGIPDIREDVEIVKSIITLAKSLGKKTVAEGVETREQLVFLTGMGVDEAQGFFFAKPMPHKEIVNFVNSYDPEQYFWPKRQSWAGDGYFLKVARP